jgi:aspartate/methionine/tyrosine aminotransferase
MAFYLWLQHPSLTGWDVAAWLARAGLLVSPGEFYGPPGAAYVRLALVQPIERLGQALDHLDTIDSP